MRRPALHVSVPGTQVRIALLALLASVIAAGCGYRVRVGEHDGGSRAACTTDADCGLGNQCACGRCLSLDLLAPACNPPCSTAAHGDFCDLEDLRCTRPDCTTAVCTGGTWHVSAFACDAGACGCPTPPPAGCSYDGCGCDALVCDPPPRCGRATCAPGTLCCNASCGLCVPPGVSCTDVECAPDCAPMDARGTGECPAAWGYGWNGTQCVAVSGCECVGSECGALFPGADECEAFFSACVRRCGTIAGLTCSGGEWCDYGTPPHHCGGGDADGVCRTRPTSCPGYVDEVCGCDVTTYSNECFANMAGVDVAHLGRCDDCDPDDATSIGPCDSVYGYAWTGTSCRSIICGCEGADCEVVAGRDEAACQSAHAECVVPL